MKSLWSRFLTLSPQVPSMPMIPGSIFPSQAFADGIQPLLQEVRIVRIYTCGKNKGSVSLNLNEVCLWITCITTLASCDLCYAAYEPTTE